MMLHNPTSKLTLQLYYQVALKGSSLTAIDAIRNLSGHNGNFYKDQQEQIAYHKSAGSTDFKMVLNSRNALLLKAIPFFPQIAKAVLKSWNKFLI
jgi:hypothetical protein